MAKKPQVYEISGAAAELFGCHWPEVLIEGPAGTGKSRAACERVHYFCRNNPGCRALLARKTRVSMTQTVLITWERDTLPPGHPCISGGAGRANRNTYVYPNGSEVVVGGMDNPDRIMSAEYDIIVFFEATEMTLEDFEKASTRLRNHMIPHPDSKHPESVLNDKGKPDIQKIRSEFALGKHADGCYPNGDPLFLEQIICDCNPGPEYHWLNRRPDRVISEGPRAGQPVMKRLLSKHEDNPTVTRKYLDVLDNLTGPRRARLRDGKWVTAEGLIWDNFDPHRHIIDGELTQQYGTGKWMLHVPKWGPNTVYLTWFAASIDWGFRAPGVIQVWGMDSKQRAFLVYEIMRTGKDKMWWAEIAEELRKKWDIQRFACDPAEPATIEMFNNRMGKVGGFWICEGAENDFAAGADSVRQRWNRDTMFLLRNAPDGADPGLAAEQKPTWLGEEIVGYSYEREKEGSQLRERPAKGSDDHACFPAGTLVMMWDGSERPIEEIDAGDEVMTPHGPRLVLRAWMTGVDREIWSFGPISATPDHGIWTANGWRRLDALRHGDILALCKSSTAGRFGTWTSTAMFGVAPPHEVITSGSRGGFGKTITVRSPRTMMSPTSTGTSRTTTSRICSSSTSRGTLRSTTPRISRRLGRLRRLGTLLLKVWRGIVNMPGSAVSGTLISRRCGVSSAVGSSSRQGPVRGSATTTARRPTAAEVASMTKYGNAGAGLTSRQIATARRSIALVPVRARPTRLSGLRDVYNLTVEGEHCYFANGVLVLNCDSARYFSMFMEKNDWQPEEERTYYAPGTYGEVMGHNEVMDELLFGI